MSDDTITGSITGRWARQRMHPSIQEIPKARSGAMSNYLLQSQAAERAMASIMARLIETGVYEVHGDEITLRTDYPLSAPEQSFAAQGSPREFLDRLGVDNVHQVTTEMLSGLPVDYTPLELRAAAHMALDDPSPCPIDRVSDAWYEGFDLGSEEARAVLDWQHPSGLPRDGRSAHDDWRGTEADKYSRDRNGDDFQELTGAFIEGYEAGFEDTLHAGRYSPGGTPNGPLGGDHYWNSSATIRTSRERRRVSPAEETPVSEPLDIYTAATRALSGGW